MNRWRLPVDHNVSRLAQGFLIALVFAPTALMFVLGIVFTAASGGSSRVAGGALMWVFILIGIQALVLWIGRAHLLGATKMSAEAPPQPPKLEPGIFHHDKRQ